MGSSSSKKKNKCCVQCVPICQPCLPPILPALEMPLMLPSFPSYPLIDPCNPCPYVPYEMKQFTPISKTFDQALAIALQNKNFWGFEEKQKEEYYKAIQCYLEFESNRKIWILSDDIKVKFKKMIDSPDKCQAVQFYKVNWAYNVDNVNYLTKNTDLEQLKSRFCSIFLNKSRTNPNTLFTANRKNCFDSLNFNQRLEKLENLDWS
ncbi:unnamed protein product, partial [Brachionus calyciflorus]